MSRIRVIAGPNGSGKSSVFSKVEKYKTSQNKLINMGPFINADDLEKNFREKGFVELHEPYKIRKPSPTLLKDYLKISTISGKYDPLIAMTALEQNDTKLIVKNPGKVSRNVYSLIGMIISDLIREELLRLGESFTMETVFSHPGKIEFIKRATSQGAKVYLYFVSTETPELNVARVKGRVKTGGHDVPEDKIRERYYKTMENLVPALEHCYRAYIYDNSLDDTIQIAEMDKDKQFEILTKTIPLWFDKYVIKKTA